MDTLTKISPALSICSLGLSAGTIFYVSQLKAAIDTQNKIILTLCSQIKELSENSDKFSETAKRVESLSEELITLNQRLNSIEDDFVSGDDENREKIQNLINQLSTSGIEITQSTRCKTKTHKKKPLPRKKSTRERSDDSGDEMDVMELTRRLRDRHRSSRGQ